MFRCYRTAHILDVIRRLQKVLRHHGRFSPAIVCQLFHHWRSPTSKSLWRWQKEPYLHALADSSLLDCQQQQLIVGGVLRQSAAVTGGAGEL